jgi:hypothetical protein
MEVGLDASGMNNGLGGCNPPPLGKTSYHFTEKVSAAQDTYRKLSATLLRFLLLKNMT